MWALFYYTSADSFSDCIASSAESLRVTRSIALILVVILAWNYLKLLLEAAERYVVLGILVFTAPLAFAMGAARGTNNIFKSWCRMFGGQLLLLIMNAWCLKLFVNMVIEFLANPLSL